MWFSFGAALVLSAAALIFAINGQVLIARSLSGMALTAPFILFLWLGRRACYVTLAPEIAALGGILYAILMVCGAWALYVQGWISPEATFGVMGVGSLVVGILLFARLLRNDQPSDDTLSADVLKSHLGYGHWAAVTSVLTWGTGNVPLLLLALWHGFEAGGALRALTNLLMPVYHLINPMSGLLIPALASPGGARRSEYLVRFGLAGLISLGILYGSMLALSARPLHHWLYAGRYDSVAVWLIPLGVVPFLHAVSSAFGSALRALGRPDSVFRAHVFVGVVMLALGIPLLLFGGVGGAVILLISTEGSGAARLWVAYRATRLGLVENRDVLVPASS